MQTISFLTVVIYLFLITSCSSSRGMYTRMVKVSAIDTSFINIRGNFYVDPQILWDNENDYYIALERMHSKMTLKDNHLTWSIKNGKEINISEDLFNYFVSTWENINKKAQSGKYKIIKIENASYIPVPIPSSE